MKTLRSKLAYLLLFGISVGQFGCDKESLQRNTITGTIRDVTNGQIISDATITLDLTGTGGSSSGKHRAISDGNGKYSLTVELRSTCGLTLMFAEKSGSYHKETYTLISQTHFDCRQEIQIIDFELCPLSCQFTLCKPDCSTLSVCKC